MTPTGPTPPDRGADDEAGAAEEAGARLVLLRTFPSALDAEVARMFLEAQGIPALVQGDDAGGMQPSLGWSHGVRLHVRWSDAIAAGAVLDADRSLDDDDDDEIIEGGMDDDGDDDCSSGGR
jgi:hypothetical protein